MDKTKQLIHIKLLYLRAENLSRKTDDISLIMLSQLLDYVVETFLKLVIESFLPPSDYLPPANSYNDKISTLQTQKYQKEMKFARVWDEVIGILRVNPNTVSIKDLPLKRDMDRLHKIRNDAQHEGVVPNPRDLIKQVPLVESFLIDTYQGIFSKDFEKLSALSLIQDAEIKEKLEKAFQYLEIQAWTKAACEGAIALKLLMNFSRKRAYAKKVIDTSSVWERRVNGKRYDLTSEKQKRANHNFNNELDRLKDHVAAIGFGIDYAEFVEIELDLPQITGGFFGKDGKYHNELMAFPSKEYTEEEARRIISFVEKQALEFQA